MSSKSLIKVTIALGFIAVAVSLSGCTIDKGELGSKKNPVKMYFVPSVDAKIIKENSAALLAHLEKSTGYTFEAGVPHSFVAVVEAFGSKRADVASINTFGYLLAHQKFGAEAKLMVIRHGLPTYQAQFIALADGPIKTLADLQGKKMAFVDPASMSGFLLPKKVLADKGIKLKEEVFAMKHDSVVTMVYQKTVDAGATFYSPSADGKIQDARKLVATQYPDVEQKVKILELTEAIPNDPIIFRKEMPEEMKTKIIDAMLSFIATPEGKVVFSNVYGVTDLKKAIDSDYDGIRTMLKTLGKDVSELAK